MDCVVSLLRRMRLMTALSFANRVECSPAVVARNGARAVRRRRKTVAFTAKTAGCRPARHKRARLLVMMLLLN